MKKLTKQYRDKTVKELTQETVILKEEIAKLRLSQKSAPAKDTNILMKKRKQLAVLLTVLTEKKEVESLKNKKI
ncbi:MAG: 50S ribosomal protein L29 [Candidatus Roizmanbacteria bacterium]